MRIDRYIAQNRVIDIQSTDLKGALSELLDACDLSKEKRLTKSRLLADLLEREKQMTTYLGNVSAACPCADEAQLHDRGRALSGRLAL